jgi:hypothetical protein
MTDETSITVRFNKPLEEWSAEDRAVILRRLREFMRERSLERTRRRRKAEESAA